MSSLRETALLALPKAETATDLFETLKTSVTQPEMPEEGDFVRIMSLHKSKGLTAKATIIAGCIQGSIPFQDFEQPASEQEAILREQRRFFLTRTRR